MLHQGSTNSSWAGVRGPFHICTHSMYLPSHTNPCPHLSIRTSSWDQIAHPSPLPAPIRTARQKYPHTHPQELTLGGAKVDQSGVKEICLLQVSAWQEVPAALLPQVAGSVSIPSQQALQPLFPLSLCPQLLPAAVLPRLRSALAPQPFQVSRA